MKRLLTGLVVIGGATGAAYLMGYGPAKAPEAATTRSAAAPAGGNAGVLPAVTVAKVKPATLQESVLITGTLVPRLEVLVAPEVEGLRVVELLADEADRVRKGQVLARLETETLKVMLAQNDANIARADAAIAQAKSAIESAAAREVEASNALERALPLRKSGALAESTLDQREAAAKSAVATTRSARDGLNLAEADRNQLLAQRRDIEWKLAKTEIKAPVDGVVSNRTTRLGSVASANVMGQPMFRMISEGQIELEAEVPEVDVARLAPGQKATIAIAGDRSVTGEVRLVSPEVDKTTRLGRVRIALGADPTLRIGSFARGTVLTRSGNGLTVPLSAVQYGGGEGPSVQIVENGRVRVRKVAIGLTAGDRVEIRSGLAEGEQVVARAGTFLREGDAVMPVKAKDEPKVN